MIEGRVANRRRRWVDRKTNNNIQQRERTKTDLIIIERNSNKVTVQRKWNKNENQESQRAIFIINIVSKAQEIVKKIQNGAAQSKMPDMQTTVKKTRSTMDSIRSAI